MSQFIQSIKGEDVAEGTAKFSLVSIIVTGLIYCIALLA